MSGQIVDSHALRSMSPEAVVQAQREGRLDALISGADIRKGKTMTADQWQRCVGEMTDAELLAAENAGLLKPLHRKSAAASARPSADQGARGQRFANGREWLRSLTPEQIVAEHRAGRLDSLLNGQDW